MLLDQGADPNLMDLDGNTALHYAVCGQSVALVKKLLEHKANIEAQNKVAIYYILDGNGRGIYCR